jgi:hypothetical protein
MTHGGAGQECAAGHTTREALSLEKPVPVLCREFQVKALNE